MTQAKSDPVRDGGWNVFRHRSGEALWCAVPPHRPIPGFLLSGQWSFSRHDLRRNTGFPEFRDRIADHSVDLQGFYLFHRFEAVAADGGEPAPGA